MAARLPTFADVLAARRRLAELACRTPLIEHPALNAVTGGRVLLKAENLQRVGAFKFRGAYNKVAQVDQTAYPGGVVACSSGNHAQGVAAAATLRGLKSAIIMPADAPRMKIERTKVTPVETIPVSPGVSHVVFTPDGKRALALKSPDNKVALLDVDGDKVAVLGAVAVTSSNVQFAAGLLLVDGNKPAATVR